MRRAVSLSVAWAALVPATLFSPPSSAANGGPEEQRGRIICLDDSGERQACGPAQSRFGLESKSGQVERFLPTDSLAGMFRDPRVRERELLVRGRLRPDGALEIIKVYSIKNGNLHDLSYFCELCNITAYEPGPCPCCRKEMELRETRVLP
jgi:hypothetical protein